MKSLSHPKSLNSRGSALHMAQKTSFSSSRPGQPRRNSQFWAALKVDGRVDANTGRQMTHRQTHTTTTLKQQQRLLLARSQNKSLARHPRLQRPRPHPRPVKTSSTEPPKLASPSLWSQLRIHDSLSMRISILALLRLAHSTHGQCCLLRYPVKVS